MRRLIVCAAAAAFLGGTGAIHAQSGGPDPRFLLPGEPSADYRSGAGPYGYGPEPGAGFAWGLPSTSWPVGPDNYAQERLRDLDGDGIRNQLDPDMDGDGVPNRDDRNPRDPGMA